MCLACTLMAAGSNDRFGSSSCLSALVARILAVEQLKSDLFSLLACPGQRDVESRTESQLDPLAMKGADVEP